MNKFLCTFSLILSTTAIAQDEFKVTDVVDSFTLNGQPAASILYCATQNDADCLSFTLNRDSLLKLLNEGLIKNQQGNNKDFDVTSSINGRRSTISEEFTSGASLKLMNRHKDNKTLSIDYFAQLYNTPDKQFPEGSYIKFERSNFILEEPHYTTLLNIVLDKPSNTQLAQLNDCDYAGQIMGAFEPTLAKMMTMTNSTYQQIAEWRVSTFSPRVSEIENKFSLTPSEAIAENREISSIVLSDVVNRSKIFIQEIFSTARHNKSDEGIKEQLRIMKGAILTYAQKCTPKEFEQYNQPQTEKKQTTTAKSPIIKMSASGICHSPNSSWYNRTNDYTAYKSIESCIANGGRLPKQ
ncbi:hypothetical protein GCM10007938_17970 [Vibrio zhanjiangensis]|uniref:DUF1311 domain-containing protein n=1 Tax=Vibrio zhanjiangensis TaxID=1046128 RepID=A0ABQ6EYZ0_9VIBR|nr:hypothetical protein [Vibrio zhanjiangensis]GLT18019.1 hypothetical protein GCM10007938_17970 [Vibrio zhanjiangensis]